MLIYPQLTVLWRLHANLLHISRVYIRLFLLEIIKYYPEIEMIKYLGLQVRHYQAGT